MTAAASAAPYANNLHLAPGTFVALANLRYINALNNNNNNHANTSSLSF